MSDSSPRLYPLRFEPIFKSMLWGGHRLPPLLDSPQTSAEPIGEAWMLSDHGDHPSRVLDGPLAGTTLRTLMEQAPQKILGSRRAANQRFPLLLKFLDARLPLSVQVHPTDAQAAELVPNGQDARGKTEAWVILETQPGAVLYAGLRPGTSPEALRRALAENTVDEVLHVLEPQPGDCVFLPAGTVHAIGAGLVLFEVQQTSDLTYRLYDWNRVDARTGLPRTLHLTESFHCIDFTAGPRQPVVPSARQGTAHACRERLVSCDYFTLDRYTVYDRCRVGGSDQCRILVCLDGDGQLESTAQSYPLKRGDVYLLPAEVGMCGVLTSAQLTLLECGLPEVSEPGHLATSVGEPCRVAS